MSFLFYPETQDTKTHQNQDLEGFSDSISTKMEENLTDVLRIQGVNAAGYGIIPKLVMQDQRLTRDAKAIYAYMCSFAGAGDTAFPSTKKICHDLGFAKIETMVKHRRQLEKCGDIKVEQERDSNGKFARNIYTLIQFPEEQPEEIPPSLPNRESVTESPFQGLGEKATPSKRDSKINRSFKNNRSIKKNTTTTDTNQNHDTMVTEETSEQKDVVVVDKPLAQSSIKPQLITKEEIKKIKELARTEGIKLTQKYHGTLGRLPMGILSKLGMV